MSTDIRLNADKRKTLVQHYETHLRNSDNKFRKAMIEAKENYDNMKDKVFELAHKVVRSHQPQEDVDTIKSMRAKYGDNGGDIHKDNCFYFINPTMEQRTWGDSTEMVENKNEIHIDFTLQDSSFANAYYYDELKSKGLDPDYQYKWKAERRNPRY